MSEDGPPAVVASDFSDSGGLDRLAVDDAGTGLGISSHPEAEAFPKGGVDALPASIQAPEAEVSNDF